MKVGILTYSRALNYGALLQAFALKNYIESVDNNILVEIIDYWPDYHNEAYKLFSSKLFERLSIPSKGKYAVGYLLGLSRNKQRRTKYKLFMKERLALPEVRTYITGEEKTEPYDLVIYGSDQIWRKHPYRFFNDFDKVYFGFFPENAKTKITYAASMGVLSESEEDMVRIKSWLTNFKAISVRETNLLSYVSKLGFPAKLVLDPVFLLSKAEWETKLAINSSKYGKSDYILLFLLVPSQDAIDIAKRLQKELKIEIKIVNRKVMPFQFGKQHIDTAAPEEFLELIYNAKFVVSTSFHGTAFSILFEKQFVALGMGDNSERSKTLLRQAGISNRYMDSIESFNNLEEIDYHSVKLSLERSIQESKDFLDQKINEMYSEA